ncbi:MAG: Tat pathway signal sequence domain protein [Nibricoccus sp.]
MKTVTRRDFMRSAALAAASTSIISRLSAKEQSNAPRTAPALKEPLPENIAPLHWLDGRAPSAMPGTTWGTPWPHGKYPKNTTFALRTASGAAVPVQSWALATWPDGSLKWTGHAMPADAPAADRYELTPGTPAQPKQPLTAKETREAVEIDTGVIRCRVPKKGTALIETISRGDQVIAQNGRLICLRQDRPEVTAGESVTCEEFIGEIRQVTLEQNGPVRAVVKIEGVHTKTNGRGWLPFVVRLYFYAGGEAVRVMHTFIFDGDEQQDFIRGLGVRFSVPMREAPYDRHVRFTGESPGLWAEAVQGLTGLRRDPGPALRAAQLAGKRCPPQSEWNRPVADELKYVPVWNDYTLTQLSADGFEIRKRTQPGHSWVKGGFGQRASGMVYVGSPSGGAAFGLRNFWQSHPTQLSIAAAASDQAEVTLWLWSPEAAPMDLRFYHDGMGQDTYQEQIKGLNITYEDYEPGFGTPHGVARTSEMMLWALVATPTRDRIVELGDALTKPPTIVCRPEYYQAAGTFGGIWSVADRSTPARAKIEDELDLRFEYYKKQIEQSHWYGFWNYGDFMHTYDADRHTWRYDVGGFAWDNSELSPDLWLWYSFLRTGRPDVFRVAEAMTRHTGEVDVYHLGRFQGLGSRHNVMHWGCSAKQVRISTAVYRRFYYYLTADERVGDLMHELIDCDKRVAEISPGRKVGRGGEDHSHPANVSFGTDWCSFVAAWLTEWERTGDVRWKDKIVAGMKSIAAMPNGWFNNGGGYEPATAQLFPHNDRASASHLNAVFGAVEINAEILQLIDVPEYDRAWLQYCEIYNASPEEQTRLFGQEFPNETLRQGHARLTAYAAMRKKDKALAARAWEEFRHVGPKQPTHDLRPNHITGPASLNPRDEIAWISTNGTAQFGLAAIQCLAMVGDVLPSD